MPDTEGAAKKRARLWELGHEQFTEELRAMMIPIPSNLFEIMERLDAITIYILRFRG